LSGIVGILNTDGAPVDRYLLQALTNYLAFRGPDGHRTWTLGSIGFGHAMLRTTRESFHEAQPFGLDGRFWITADARIDCRAELVTKLQNSGRKLVRAATDPELILHAYAVWNEGCVQHLRGDFSFAIWDIYERKVFCARDHFGIKPFYYAQLGGTFVFSNTLNCVRLHPRVADELNEAAVLDFLLAGMNWDNATTTFRDVRRLPPAHFFVISANQVRFQRYWELPVDGRIRLRDEREYAERFQELLRSAVSDRLRADRTGIFLSGGLDSSSIAAAARQSIDAGMARTELRAYTVISEPPIPDQEGAFAKKVAEHLQIPIQFHQLSEPKLLDPAGVPENGWPEPLDDPFFSELLETYQVVASDCRVVLDGEGSDALMSFEMKPYARDLWRHKEWGQLLASLARFLRVRRLPIRGAIARVQKLFGRGSLVRAFPTWISPDLAMPSKVKERWTEITRDTGPKTHPVVPLAYASLSVPRWTWLFETGDPGVTRCPIEVAYPFIDLRIVEFLLAIPPFPWFYEKALIRRAMVGKLPVQILTRPKTPLTTDPLVAQLQLPSARSIDSLQWSKEIPRFVNVRAVPKLAGETSSERARVGVWPHCLNFWLQYSRAVRYNFVAEAVNG